jgi:tRNA-modifying protein YgfZ
MTLAFEESYRALTAGAGAVELAREAITVKGPQAVEYLQGQLSQDVENLGAGQSTLSLLLEPQGKISAFLRVTRTGSDSLLLDFDAGHLDAVVDRLRRFKLRTKADIEVLEGWRAMALRGPGLVIPALGEEPEGGGDVLMDPVRAAFDWPGLVGVDLLGSAPEAPAGVELCDPAAYEVLRIEVGLPVMGHELEERTIPEETGLVAATVSFTKGCYTGQELVARIDSRGGNVPRRLRGVVSAGEEPAEMAVGQAVTADGREIGRLTSVAVSPVHGPVALAYIKRGNEPPVRAQLDGEGAEVDVVALPLARDRGPQ